MTKTLKYFLIITALTIGLAIPPTKAMPLKTTEAPILLSTIEMQQTLPVEEIEPAQSLTMADYDYKPMGTYANQYTDQSQCVWGVASMKGNIPWSGNANQWDDEARARGITVSPVPIVGSVAQTDAGEYGHVATVVGMGYGTVTVTEKNYDYHGGVRTVTVPTNTYQYLYL